MKSKQMNRREFFKTTGVGITSIAVFPASSVLATEPTKPIILKKNKKYWKQYFRDTTQEHNVDDMIKDNSTQEAKIKAGILSMKRYYEDTYVQIRDSHTDKQIDKLPDTSGKYLIFRIQFKQIKTESIPKTELRVVSTTIVLEV